LFRITFNNPFNWVANKLSPAVTGKTDKDTNARARLKQAQEGKGSLFDAVAIETEESTLAAPVVPRKKFTEVRIHSAMSSPLEH
jgi:hypothetical protein